MLIGTKLLYSDFDYHGKTYDVYGLPATEDEECLVDEICLAGTRMNVIWCMPRYDVQMIAHWVGVQRQMDRLTELREARADRVMYEREVKKMDHTWRSF